MLALRGRAMTRGTRGRDDSTSIVVAGSSVGDAAHWQHRAAVDPVQYQAWCDAQLASMGPTPLDAQRHAADGVNGAGSALPHGDAIQASFGHHDISDVKAHVGGPAAEASSAMGAHAYATGNRVAFAASPDLHLAAHEAAHVVQQRGGVQLKGGVGQTGDAYEQHADAVAAMVVRGESAAELLDASPRGGTSGPSVQRFDGDEHKDMGDQATHGEQLKEFADLGIPMSFGDGVMISGDVLGYLRNEKPLGGDRSSAGYLRDLLRHGGKDGRDEVLFAIWFAKSNASRGPEPDASPEIKARVRARYFQLARENEAHFSHGGTARETYLSLHNQALRKAQRSAEEQAPALFEEAKTDEAFAQHYLSDMFAGGHVRTPRSELNRHEDARDMPSIDSIVAALAWEIFAELETMGDFGAITQVPLVGYVVHGKIVAMIKEKGGNDLNQASYSALISKALHDKDGEGLNVVSERSAFGPQQPGAHHWHTVGDGHVLKDGVVTAEGAETHRMAITAMSISRQELDAAAAWRSSSANPAFTPESVHSGKALEFVPDVDAEHPNTDLASNTDNWDAAVDAAIRQEMLPRLIGFFPDTESEGKKTPATLRSDGKTLHIGTALRKVAARINASPSEWLRQASSFPVPNVHGDGPPDIAGVSDGPVDAGVPQ